MSGLYLFAYGTLRTGQPNHSMIRPAILEHCGIARLRGARLFAYYGGHFPFIISTGDEMEPDVVGEVFRMHPAAPHFADVLSMEVAAGYEVRRRTVYLDTPDDYGRKGIEVVVCEFPADCPEQYDCERIDPGGHRDCDWLDYVNARRELRATSLQGITDVLSQS